MSSCGFGASCNWPIAAATRTHLSCALLLAAQLGGHDTHCLHAVVGSTGNLFVLWMRCPGNINHRQPLLTQRCR